MNKRRRGQRDSFTGGNSGAGALLACWFGVPGLKRLSDEDAAALADILRIIVSQVHDEAFKAGWDAMSLYNYDERLLSAGWPTNH